MLFTIARSNLMTFLYFVRAIISTIFVQGSSLLFFKQTNSWKRSIESTTTV